MWKGYVGLDKVSGRMRSFSWLMSRKAIEVEKDEEVGMTVAMWMEWSSMKDGGHGAKCS